MHHFEIIREIGREKLFHQTAPHPNRSVGVRICERHIQPLPRVPMPDQKHRNRRYPVTAPGDEDPRSKVPLDLAEPTHGPIEPCRKIRQRDPARFAQRPKIQEFGNTKTR